MEIKFSNPVVSVLNEFPNAKNVFAFKPRPNALDFSLYIARQMSSIVECCREEGGQTLSTFHYTLLDKCRALLSGVERGVAKRSRLFTRLGTQHSMDVLFDE